LQEVYSVTHLHRVKIDPGSKTTGIAVVAESTGEAATSTLEVPSRVVGGRVTTAVEVAHRGQAIRDSLLSRRVLRRGRRNRKTRYRQPRFLNRTRKEGWLPPSLESRIANIMTWVQRIRKFCPISAISQELV